MYSGSKPLRLDKNDLIKIGKGALIAAGGAALTYLSEAVTGLDFGQFTPIVMTVFSAGIQFLRKLLADNS